MKEGRGEEKGGRKDMQFRVTVKDICSNSMPIVKDSVPNGIKMIQV